MSASSSARLDGEAAMEADLFGTEMAGRSSATADGEPAMVAIKKERIRVRISMGESQDLIVPDSMTIAAVSDMIKNECGLEPHSQMWGVHAVALDDVVELRLALAISEQENEALRHNLHVEKLKNELLVGLRPEAKKRPRPE
jgi:hypothetical protein